MIKQITAILGVLAAVASLSLADSGPEASATDTKKMVQNNFVETAQKGVKLSGYVDAGYSYNFTGSGNQSVVNSRLGSDSAAAGDFNLYAVKIALEKAMTSENKAQAGFRADVLIGEDANYLIPVALVAPPTRTKIPTPCSSSRRMFPSAPPWVTAGTSRLVSSFRSSATRSSSVRPT